MLLATIAQAEPVAPIAVWKMRHFTPEELARGLGNDLATPAGDQIPNLVKYALHLPVSEWTGAAPLVGTVWEGRARLSFTRLPTATDVDYIVEGSPDLATWRAATVRETALAPGPDGTQVVTMEDSAALAKKQFLRLRIARNTGDSDQDSLDDDWELRHFGNLAQSGDGDFDGDGVSDRGEQTAETPPEDFYDGAPMPADPQSDEYVAAAAISDPAMQTRIRAWILGLKRLNLYSRAVSMISLVDSQNRPGSRQLIPLTGPAPTLAGAPLRDSRGIHFSGNGTEYVAFANPLKTPALPSVSIFAVFDSNPGANQLVAGSFVWGQMGPSLLAGGSPYSGPDSADLFFDATTNGSTHALPLGGPGQRTYGVGNAGVLQTACATFGPTQYSCQGGYDRRYEAKGNFQPVWNDNAEWRIGLNNSGGYAFSGSIAFVALFDSALDDAQYQALRRLYRDTLGAHLEWPINAVMEGDSLTGESSGLEWSRKLRALPNWQGKFSKRNVARDGETVDHMLAQFSEEVVPLAREPGKKYLFLWGGRNGLGGESPALLASIRKYWSLARNAGFRVAAFTVIPAASDVASTTAFRKALNEAIRSARSEYDYLIDVDALPSLSDPHDPTYFLPDGIHLNSAGHQEVAKLINATIVDP